MKIHESAASGPGAWLGGQSAQGLALHKQGL